MDVMDVVEVEELVEITNDVKAQNTQLRKQVDRLIEIIRGLPQGSLEPMQNDPNVRKQFLREIIHEQNEMLTSREGSSTVSVGKEKGEEEETKGDRTSTEEQQTRR